jgi:glyoxylase-like metal-dependent hydrolase (beta-lactamase superfamily II)
MAKQAAKFSRKIVRVMVGNVGTNCYLLADSGEAAIIDPGSEPEHVMSELRALENEDPKHPKKLDVKYIINTHGHVDHMGANAQIKRLTGAPILIGKKDAAQLTDAQQNLSTYFDGPVVSPKADLLLGEGDKIRVGMTVLKVLDAPGHTEGGICLMGDGFVFTGDTLFYASIGRVDFPGGSEKQIFASIKRLIGMLSDDTMIYPGHNDPGLLRDIKRVNPFLSYYR